MSSAKRLLIREMGAFPGRNPGTRARRANSLATFSVAFETSSAGISSSSSFRQLASAIRFLPWSVCACSPPHDCGEHPAATPIPGLPLVFCGNVRELPCGNSAGYFRPPLDKKYMEPRSPGQRSPGGGGGGKRSVRWALQHACATILRSIETGVDECGGGLRNEKSASIFDCGRTAGFRCPSSG